MSDFAVFQENDPAGEFNIVRKGGTQRFFDLVAGGAVFEDMHLIPSEIRDIGDFDQARTRCGASIYAFANPLLDGLRTCAAEEKNYDEGAQGLHIMSSAPTVELTRRRDFIQASPG